MPLKSNLRSDASRFLKWLALTICMLCLAIVGLGEILIKAAPKAVGDAPAALEASSIEMVSPNGERLHGWISPGAPGKGAVLLLHGVRASRLDMVPRALFLHALGYTVFLIDLPAHGESDGAHITYGLDEAIAVRTALFYLAAQYPHEKVGVVALSLGAASFVLANAQPAPAAVVLESMFPTIREALANRLHVYFGPLGSALTPVFLTLLRLRLGISSDRLEPIALMPSLHTPVLIAAGSSDRYTTAAETQRIFESANQPKTLWLVPGAGHVDLYRYRPAEYELKVSRFLAAHLRDGVQR